MSTAALIGNGFSISYNPALSIDRLTAGLLVSFRQGGDDLAAVAATIDPNSSTGFENLLGSFDSVSRLLETLPGLGGETPFGPRLAQLSTAAQAARQLYREGVAIALRLIAQRSHGEPDAYEAVDGLCMAIAALDEPDAITIGTLNYDGLLHSGFLREWVDFRDTHHTLEISDMGDGRSHECETTDFSGGRTLDSWLLRGLPDLMSDSAWLLNLHGSLGWLRSIETGQYRKFQIDDLRQCEYWNALATGGTEWEPAVVLTDQKDSVNERYPFSVAYRAFWSRLISAQRWLVAGYGRGDYPVNQMFRLACEARQHLDMDPPAVLVVGIDERETLVRGTSRDLSIPVDWIVASGLGLPEALETQECERWAT